MIGDIDIKIPATLSSLQDQGRSVASERLVKCVTEMAHRGPCLKTCQEMAEERTIAWTSWCMEKHSGTIFYATWLVRMCAYTIGCILSARWTLYVLGRLPIVPTYFK